MLEYSNISIFKILFNAFRKRFLSVQKRLLNNSLLPIALTSLPLHLKPAKAKSLSPRVNERSPG
jgi:hypothetical protein